MFEKKTQNTGNLALCINWFLRSEYNTVKLMILVDLYFHWKVTNTAYTEILSKVIHLVDLTMSHLLKMLTSNKNACWYCLTYIIVTSCLCILVKSWFEWFERTPPPLPIPKNLIQILKNCTKIWYFVNIHCLRLSTCYMYIIGLDVTSYWLSLFLKSL